MFERVLAEQDLWIGEMRAVVVQGIRLLVVRHESGVSAYHDRCPHQGYALSEGRLDAGVITCRAHQHSFDATTGHGVNPLRPCLTPVLVQVEDGQIMIEATAQRRALP